MDKLFYPALTALCVLAAVLLCRIMALARGYPAIGGEICVLAIPAIVWAVHRTWRDFHGDGRRARADRDGGGADLGVGGVGERKKEMKIF